MIEQIAGPIFLSIISYMLIFTPLTVAKFLGGIYWRMGKFTALGKSDETKKYFYSQNPFWFRVLGFLMAGLFIASVFAQFSILR